MSGLGAAGCKWTTIDQYCGQYYNKDGDHCCRKYGNLDSNWQDEPFRATKCEEEVDLRMSKRGRIIKRKSPIKYLEKYDSIANILRR
jgi:hypothetical protein